MPDGRVVELAQRLRFSEEPGPGGLVGVEVDPQADATLEDLVVRLEQHPRGRRGRDPFETIARPECLTGALEGQDRWGGAQRSEPRLRSTRVCRPQIEGSHQRRLRVGEPSVKKTEQVWLAQRRTVTSGSARVRAAD